MKKVITLICLLCVLFSSARGATNDFSIVVALIKGERSKDSHMTTNTLIIKGRELYYQEAYSGRKPPNLKDVYKDFKLTDDDLQTLREIIAQWKLPDSTTNKYEKELGSNRGRNYFFLTLQVKLNGKETLIKLTGDPQQAGIEEDGLYQTSETLIKEIFRIIQRQDETIDYRGMIR